MDLTILFVIFVILIVLSGFFSSSETAFTRLNRLRVKLLADEGNEKAKKALLIFDNYDITIATILFCNNIVNIGAASIGTVIMLTLLPDNYVKYVPLFSTIIVTAIVLIFAEVLPKSYANANSEKLALRVSGVVLALIRILKPISLPILKLNNLISKSKDQEKATSVTEDELKAYIDAIEEEGVLEEEEGDLVRSVLDFDETTIGDILTPRTEVIGIDITCDTKEVLEIIYEEKFSRLPLYDDNLDNIIGIVYERDIFVHLTKYNKVNLKEIARPVFFVPKSMKASNLLKYFQERNAQMAIVIDEHGGTNGLVTMEDLLEEIVGDIWDEHDEVVEKIVEKNGYLIVSNATDLDDFFEEYLDDEVLPDTEYSTLSGWVYELLEVIPSKGDTVSYETSNYLLEMEVIEIANNRIEKLKVNIIKRENKANEIKEIKI